MADTVKSVRELKMEFGFYDGDTRTESLPNPRADLTAADIKAVGAAAAGAIIGDKAGAVCTGIQAAEKFSKTTTYIDLTEI